ncbi:hypothetical protein SPRG_22128 [Saprolegnia parasitica CBS 223.65]|uniref:Uncharacterized protein n=1 Tax=Saprolegnia parasitica (strain CBS 223.65) TaxID=695850 RepID=A0A067CWB8_SAPPC|nr:hypothetical protein SPRG_22128 [Saprolegnia parasitica CBS 223.65]KDO31087.1 hypothetical protein SPRG_22128 [Saprolegnia parasitica CBS 223.65]|eukprot:XP_012198357.1 hypothetical protein SPRG_22128 [Saprolegnia parasitica CBS 223.65]
MASIAGVLGDDFVSAYLMDFLFATDLEALGLTCKYLQRKVSALLRVRVRRQYPDVFGRQPIFRLPPAQSTIHRPKRRLRHRHQRCLYSFFQHSQNPIFHGLLGRLSGTGHLFHADRGGWVFNPETETFEIDWVDSTSSLGDAYDSDDSVDVPRRYATLDDNDDDDNDPDAMDRDGPSSMTSQRLAELAEASIGNDWQPLADALAVHAVFKQLCADLEANLDDDALVVQGAFPILLRAPSLLHTPWSASALHRLVLPYRPLSPAATSPFGLALHPTDCIFSHCACIDWDLIDDDEVCHACAQQDADVWPPREVMYRWLLPGEEEPLDTSSAGPHWRLGIACAGLFGDDVHWNTYKPIGDGNFVCNYCIDQGLVRDPREYNMCRQFVRPLKAAMRAHLDSVRMETYIDNSSVHVFGGVHASGFFLGVVCYEVDRELLGRVGIY